jgi:hypothetical protein
LPSAVPRAFIGAVKRRTSPEHNAPCPRSARVFEHGKGHPTAQRPRRRVLLRPSLFRSPFPSPSLPLPSSSHRRARFYSDLPIALAITARVSAQRKREDGRRHAERKPSIQLIQATDAYARRHRGRASRRGPLPSAVPRAFIGAVKRRTSPEHNAPCPRSARVFEHGKGHPTAQRPRRRVILRIPPVFGAVSSIRRDAGPAARLRRQHQIVAIREPVEVVALDRRQPGQDRIARVLDVSLLDLASPRSAALRSAFHADRYRTGRTWPLTATTRSSCQRPLRAAFHMERPRPHLAQTPDRSQSPALLRTSTKCQVERRLGVSSGSSTVRSSARTTMRPGHRR